jgi:hypothetical protein
MSTSLITITNSAIVLVSVAVGFVIAKALSKYKQQSREVKHLREALSRAGKAITNDDIGKDDSEPSTTEESFGFGLSYSAIAALTAILIPLGLWFGLHVGLKLFGLKDETMTNAPVMLTLVVLAGVIGLLAVLMMTALAFSAVKLSDKTQALGLPEGSVRAVIALSLIVIFVITVVFLFEGLSPRLGHVEHQTLEQANAVPAGVFVSKHAEDSKVAELQKKADALKAKALPDAADAAKTQADAATKAQDDATAAAKGALYTVERFVDPSRGSEDFAKQIITTISTLVVSISAFYFGSSTAISAQKSAQTPSAPVISKQPADVSVSAGQPAEFSVEATGPNLSYQWQKVVGSGATDISGATKNTYRIPSVTAADTGSAFACKITNPGGTVTSTAAKLTVT